MKADTRIYLAATVLAAAAGGLYYTRSQSSKQAQQHTAPTSMGSAVAATELPTFALEKEAAPTKLVIENAGKGKVVLEKKGEAWELVEPIKAPANAAHVKSLLDNLKELKGKEVIDKTAASYASYDLADAKALHVVATLGDGKSHEVWFGKSGSRGQTARVAGRDGVFTVEKYQSFLYAREAKNWRENAIAKVDDAAVESVEVANKHGRFVFTKSGDKWSGEHTARDKDGKLEKKPQAKQSDDPTALPTSAPPPAPTDGPKPDAGMSTAEEENNESNLDVLDELL